MSAFKLLKGTTLQVSSFVHNPPADGTNPIWSTSDPAVLTVTPNDPPTTATVTAVADGFAAVELSMDGMQTSFEFGVIDPTVTALSIIPGTPTT